MSGKIKILIIDDSALVREALKEVFSTDSELEVIGMANDPYEAAKMLRTAVPDVITLDLQMPRMDGLTFLRKLMQQHPIPVVVISSLTQKGKESAMKALEYGAAEVVTKPKINSSSDFASSSEKLCHTVKAASKAKLSILKSSPTVKRSQDLDDLPKHRVIRDTIIAMGASTGGTEAIKTVLQTMPSNGPGIVIVQHMPAGFTHQFAMRLDRECPVSVKEAEDGDKVEPGKVLIAPGNMHMYLRKSAGQYFVSVKHGDPVNRHMPSVDELFFSVAKIAGKKALGVLMTGMGKDGAKGLLEMKKNGARTIAQDEKSSVVFGMPREAIHIGGADFVDSLSDITPRLVKILKQDIENTK
jgi:two-component system chemotaxis response regulator CheB